MSIRKHRRRFQRIRRQQMIFAKAAGLGRLNFRTVNPHLLWAFSRLALALQKADWRRHRGTPWGHRHPKPVPRKEES